MNKKDIVGIYKIECIANNKVYIGQSINIKKRLYDHKTRLRKGTHKNKHLQNAWNKYGEDNFTFETLIQCDKDELDDKEIFYIEKYNSANVAYGFNKTFGGKSFINFQNENNEDINIDNVCLNFKKRKVLQFDIEGNLIKIWDSVNSIFKENINWSQTPLRNCLRIKDGHYTYKNCFWIYQDKYSDELLKNLMNKKLNSHRISASSTRKSDRLTNAEFLRQLNKSRCIKINQYDINHKLIKTWQSQSELNKNGFCHCTISKRLKDGKLYKGFYFSIAS